jgi:hypothetical protein
MLSRLAWGQGRDGRKGREDDNCDDNEPPRTRRLAIKISEYETLEVQPYRKGQKKKDRKQKQTREKSSSRSPKANSVSNHKKSAVFDYGNIYNSGPLEETEDFFTNSSIASAHTVSSSGSSALPSRVSTQAGSLPPQGEESRFISPIRSGGPCRDNNPLELRNRTRKDKAKTDDDPASIH